MAEANRGQQSGRWVARSVIDSNKKRSDTGGSVGRDVLLNHDVQTLLDIRDGASHRRQGGARQACQKTLEPVSECLIAFGIDAANERIGICDQVDPRQTT